MLNRKQQTCSWCRGEKSVTCTFCNGIGKLAVPQILGNKSISATNCAVCQGTGKRSCLSCGGKGYIETFDITSAVESNFTNRGMTTGFPSNLGHTAKPFDGRMPSASWSETRQAGTVPSGAETSSTTQTVSTGFSVSTDAAQSSVGRDVLTIGIVVLIVVGAILIEKIL